MSPLRSTCGISGLSRQPSEAAQLAALGQDNIDTLDATTESAACTSLRTVASKADIRAQSVASSVLGLLTGLKRRWLVDMTMSRLLNAPGRSRRIVPAQHSSCAAETQLNLLQMASGSRAGRKCALEGAGASAQCAVGAILPVWKAHTSLSSEITKVSPSCSIRTVALTISKVALLMQQTSPWLAVAPKFVHLLALSCSTSLDPGCHPTGTDSSSKWRCCPDCSRGSGVQ